MDKYHNQLLPSVFNSLFTKVDQVYVIQDFTITAEILVRVRSLANFYCQ